MSDRIHPPTPHSAHGPHPAAGELTIYDRGYSWCAQAHVHPRANGDRFDGDRHVPPNECRSREAFLDDVRDGLDGEDLGLSVHIAAPFRHGAPRDGHTNATPRIVIETWRSDEHSRRFSISAGDALRLTRILEHAVDQLLYPPPAV